MPRALVVPLPVRVQRVELHAPPSVRHPELTPASLQGVKFHRGRRGRIEGDAAGQEKDAANFSTCTRTFTSSSTVHSTPVHLDIIGRDLAFLCSINKHKMNLYSQIMLLLAFTINIGLFDTVKCG